MKFPDVLTIRVIDKTTRKALSGVAFVLVLKAVKNDYYIGPKITDVEGLCSFSRESCEQSIATAQKMFIMDYSGSLLDCSPIAELRMHSPEHIQAMIRQYESNPGFWGLPFRNPDVMFEQLHKVSNEMFEPFHVFVSEDEIRAFPEVHIELRRRDPAPFC